MPQDPHLQNGHTRRLSGASACNHFIKLTVACSDAPASVLRTSVTRRVCIHAQAAGTRKVCNGKGLGAPQSRNTQTQRWGEGQIPGSESLVRSKGPQPSDPDPLHPLSPAPSWPAALASGPTQVLGCPAQTPAWFISLPLPS